LTDSSPQALPSPPRLLGSGRVGRLRQIEAWNLCSRGLVDPRYFVPYFTIFVLNLPCLLGFAGGRSKK